MADKKKDIKEDVLGLIPDKPGQSLEDEVVGENSKNNGKFKINKLAIALGIACIVLVITLACTLYALFMSRNETKKVLTELDLCKRGAFSGMIGHN